MRFVSELDKLEKRRHEEAERELLLRAAKSRTKGPNSIEKFWLEKQLEIPF